MGLVYVVHRVAEDLTPAKQFGELKFINKAYCFPDQLEGQRLPEKICAALLEAADQFDPDKDYLVLVGDFAQQCQFTFYLARSCDWFRALRYDRQAQGYITIWVSSRVAPWLTD